MTDLTLLLVEDDPSLQEGVRDLLEIAEFTHPVEIETASDGVEALQLMNEKMVDLVISDIMMPNMSGIELLEHVRQNPDWVHVPFIFVSAKGRKRDMIEGRLSGAEMYITKPFDSLELIDMIKIQLNRSLKTRAHQQKEMSSLKREVMQVLNHEFRTPLTYVTAYYEMLATSFSVYQDTENMGEYLRGIRSGCERMGNLVEDMIQVMDVRTDDMFHRYRDDGGFCQDGVAKFMALRDAFEPVAQKEKVEMEIHLPETMPMFFCLETEYFRAIGHLIENAIKFSNYRINQGEAGRIDVKIDSDGRQLSVVIKDNGVGIPTAVQSQIFNIFFQHNREKFEQQGSGVGLTIAKGVINAHHGSLSLVSEENVGTEVTALIPLMPTFPSETDFNRLTNGDSGPDKDQRTVHILIVEDEETVREALADLLKIAKSAYHYTLDVACDGVEGLALVAKRKPDLIISDVMMPNMDGYEFVETLRKNDEYLQIPVIFLSARTGRQEIMHGRRIGAEDYLTKPYDSEELLSMITAVLNRYFQLRKRADSDFEQLKLNILSMLRPDFLGSLSDVDNYSSLLDGSSDDLNNSADLRDALRGIQVGSQRISELVEDFISLAEIQTGEAQLSFNNHAQPFGEINVLIEQLISNLPQRESGQVNHQLLAAQQIGSVMVDLPTLERSLKRLIGVSEINCLKGGGQSVFIELEEAVDHLKVVIWHDGRNLEPETCQLIQKIMQSEPNNWTNQGADDLIYGPRLLIARHLIEINQGRLHFISGLGEDGSLTSDSFMVQLPMADQAAADSGGFDLDSLQFKSF